MTAVLVVWVIVGPPLILAAMHAAARMPLRPRGYLADPGAESVSPVLYARLVPSHRELPGRPSAGATAGPVYVITDAKEVTRHGS